MTVAARPSGMVRPIRLYTCVCVPGSGMGVSDFRVSGYGFRVPDFGFPVPDFGCRIKRSGFKVGEVVWDAQPHSGAHLGYASGFGGGIFRFRYFGVHVSNSGFRDQGTELDHIG